MCYVAIYKVLIFSYLICLVKSYTFAHLFVYICICLDVNKYISFKFSIVKNNHYICNQPLVVYNYSALYLMKERIAKIIEYENLSSTMFAERLGIGKAVVSHILNGRNNPSLDVISRIMLTMPHFNSEWLINGEGEMLKPNYIDTSMTGGGTLFAQEGENSPQSTVSDDKIDRIEVDKLSEVVQSAENKSDTLILARNRKIKQIIIYYDDNTFETFFSK